MQTQDIHKSALKRLLNASESRVYCYAIPTKRCEKKIKIDIN